MAAYNTRRDLVSRALDVLGVGSVGQAPTDADFIAVDDRVDGFVLMLRAENIIAIQNVDAIPAAYLSPLANLLAFEMITPFALESDEEARVSALRADALRSIRVMTMSGPTFERLEALYF